MDSIRACVHELVVHLVPMAPVLRLNEVFSLLPCSNDCSLRSRADKTRICFRWTSLPLCVSVRPVDHRFSCVLFARDCVICCAHHSVSPAMSCISSLPSTLPTRLLSRIMEGLGRSSYAGASVHVYSWQVGAPLSNKGTIARPCNPPYVSGMK